MASVYTGIMFGVGSGMQLASPPCPR